MAWKETEEKYGKYKGGGQEVLTEGNARPPGRESEPLRSLDKDRGSPGGNESPTASGTENGSPAASETGNESPAASGTENGSGG